MMRVLLGLFLLLLASAAIAGPLRVVTSFSILDDLVRQVGGELVDSRPLVGPDADAHAYEPTPGDARRLAAADLVIVNGLGFEGWIPRLVRASGYRGPLVTASQGISPLQLDGHSDPHAWQDIAHVRHYVAVIAAALAKADPANADAYRGRADAYRAELEALERWVRAELARVPPAKRRVITHHDAFGYFGQAYGIEFLAPSGWVPEAQPSAGTLARLIEQIRAQRVGAVFLENISNPRLIEGLAREGAPLGGTLYADALSAPEGPAGTYTAMIRHNVRTLLAALTAAP